MRHSCQARAAVLVLGMLDSWAAVELWIIEFLAVSVLWVLDVLAVSVGCSFLGCFFGPCMDAKHMTNGWHSWDTHFGLMRCSC